MIRLLSVLLPFLVLCASASSAGGDDSIPPPPPAGGSTGDGLLVDDYDGELFAGAFKDDQGSTIELDVRKHADGKGGYLLCTYDTKADGYIGFWAVVGKAWDVKQDWSQAKALAATVWADRPVELQFVIKADGERQYVATVKVIEAGKWVTVRVPAAEWANIASGLGIVGGFDVRPVNPAAARFAIDELRVEGGAETDQAGQKVELDPRVIFAKTLVPPTERSDKTYVVDNRHSAADDANAGTDEAKPLRSIQRAADLVKPGDTVLVKDGTYVEHATPDRHGVLMKQSGAPDAWITFKAFPGHRPKVTSPTWGTFTVEDVAYIEINGFDITTTEIANNSDPRNTNKNSGNGIGVGRAHHIRLLNNVVHGCGGGGIAMGNSDYVTIEGNVVHDNAFWAIYNCSGISHFEGRDFDDKPGYHIVIRNNVAYRNENKGPTPLYGGKLTDGNGIIVDWHRGTGRILIENNLCFDNGGRGAHVFQSKHVDVRNNTLVYNGRTTDGGVDARINSGDDVHFVNNIIVGRPGQAFEGNYRQGENATYRNNLFHGYGRVAEKNVDGSNLIGVDPDFRTVDLALLDGESPLDVSRFDFRLAPVSPALGKADAGNAPPDDLLRRPRPQGDGSDLGAYEQ